MAAGDRVLRYGSAIRHELRCARAVITYFRTVTKQDITPRCRWCGHVLAVAVGPGRPKLYCRQSCRQRAYELRRRQLAGALRPGEVPITTDDFERLRDGVYRLTSALEDVDLDIAEVGDYEAAFRHLYEAASDLRAFEFAIAAGD